MDKNLEIRMATTSPEDIDILYEYIYKLGDIRHGDPVTMLVEYIKIYSCHKSISHCILLIQESRIGTRLNIIPCTPFVNHQANLMILIILVHDSGMAADKFIHKQGLV